MPSDCPSRLEGTGPKTYFIVYSIAYGRIKLVFTAKLAKNAKIPYLLTWRKDQASMNQPLLAMAQRPRMAAPRVTVCAWERVKR